MKYFLSLNRSQRTLAVEHAQFIFSRPRPEWADLVASSMQGLRAGITDLLNKWCAEDGLPIFVE